MSSQRALKAKMPWFPDAVNFSCDSSPKKQLRSNSDFVPDGRWLLIIYYPSCLNAFEQRVLLIMEVVSCIFIFSNVFISFVGTQFSQRHMFPCSDVQSLHTSIFQLHIRTGDPLPFTSCVSQPHTFFFSRVFLFASGDVIFASSHIF